MKEHIGGSPWPLQPGMRCSPPAVELLERERELALLAGARREAAAGAGRLVVIEGAAGAGKTALLGAFAARNGGRVLHASGAEFERDVAFGVARELFERAVHDDRSLLDGAAALAGRVLLEPTPRSEPEAVHAANHGLYWLVAGLAARAPLTLVVDDVQWADEASLRWLAYLGRRLDGLALLVVVAGRDASAAFDQVATDRLRVGPLSPGAVARSLEGTLGAPVHPAFARACHEATGGNPFLLGELTTSLRASGTAPDAPGAPLVAVMAPAGIARAVLTRIAPLGVRAERFAEAVAVLNGDARLDRVAVLSDLRLEEAARIADQLAAADVLAPGDPVRFLHPVMRAAVHERIPAHRLGLAHAAAADLLRRGRSGPERAAAHLLPTAPAGRVWVSETLRGAATTALARGAPDTAVRLLRRALAEDDRTDADLLLDLASAEFVAQDPAAVAHAREALVVATLPAARVRAALVLARALTVHGRYDEALAALAAAEGTPGLMEVERRTVAVETAMLMSWRSGVGGLDPVLTRFGTDELAGTTPPERALLAMRAMERVSAGLPREDGIAAARRALAHADPAAPEDEHAVLMAARCLGIAGELDEAREPLTAVLAAGRRRGAPNTVVTACLMLAEVETRAGRLAAAETDVREGLAIALEHEAPVNVVVGLAMLTEVVLDRESPEAAVELLASGPPPEELPPGYPRNMLLQALGRAAAATGDLETAVARLAAAGEGRDAWASATPPPALGARSWPRRSRSAATRTRRGRSRPRSSTAPAASASRARSGSRAARPRCWTRARSGSRACARPRRRSPWWRRSSTRGRCSSSARSCAGAAGGAMRGSRSRPRSTARAPRGPPSSPPAAGRSSSPPVHGRGATA